MTLAEAIALLNTLLALPDAAGVKSIIIQIAEAAGLPAEGFLHGDPSERWIEIAAQAMVDWGWTPQMAVRACFFALATDPGDVDDFGAPDRSEDQTPRPGFLSAMGVGFWGTERRGQTFATAFVTIRNDGDTATTPFVGGALTFEASGESREDGGVPTYVSVPDASIYTGIGNTLVLAPNASVEIPVIAVQIGEYGSTAGADDIDVCVTQSYGTLTVTSSTKATGSEREDRLDYIERCELQGDSLAPGGPGRAYLRAMNTARDGSPLQRHDGSGPVTITMAYVSADSPTGEVTLYYGGDDGAVDAVDVDSANANIIGLELGVITDPSGVLPDCVGLLPKVYSAEALPDGTPGGDSCTNDELAVNYFVKLPRASLSGSTAGTYGVPWVALTDYVSGQKIQNGARIYICTSGGTSAGSGGPTGTGTGISDGSVTWNYSAAAATHTTATLGVLDTIAAAVSSYRPGRGIGGDDKVSGAGVIYTVGITVAVGSAMAGLYDPIVTVPAASTTAVALGHVSVAGAITGTMVIV